MAKGRTAKEARRVRVQKSSGSSICGTCIAAAAMTWGFCLMWLVAPILFAGTLPHYPPLDAATRHQLKDIAKFTGNGPYKNRDPKEGFPFGNGVYFFFFEEESRNGLTGPDNDPLFPATFVDTTYMKWDPDTRQASMSPGSTGGFGFSTKFSIMGVHLPVGPAFFINTIRALRAGYIFRFPPNSDDHCDVEDILFNVGGFLHGAIHPALSLPLEFKMKKATYEGIPCWDRETYSWGFISPDRDKSDTKPSHVYKLLEVIDGDGKVNDRAFKVMLEHASSPEVYFPAPATREGNGKKTEL